MVPLQTLPVGPAPRSLADDARLGAPVVRAGTVPRRALVDELLAASDASVVSITAPAGYGKTTLVHQWAEADARSFAWVTLERRDNDPVVLLTAVATAVDRIERIDPDVLKALAVPAVSIWSSAAPGLGAALAALTQPIALVLDDIHELHEPDAVDVVVGLAGSLPAGSRLIVAGRAEPWPELARVRASGRLLELDAADLALDDDEAHALLHAAGVELSRAAATALNKRAEGWPAGLYLAGLALRLRHDVVGGWAPFAGHDRFVTDYLRLEHLAGLTPERRHFLLETSVLDTMCAPLCDALLDRDDSALMLDELERANLFVIPLDHHREWYRYHHLFRDVLRNELARVEPAAAVELNRRAADWCETHGRPELALDYAQAAEDTPRVARLIATLAVPFHERGRVATVQGWLDDFDAPELLERHGEVAAVGAWLHAIGGHAGEAARWLAAGERAPANGPLPDGSWSTRPWLALTRAIICVDGIERARHDAEVAVRELGATSALRPAALLLLGMTYVLAGDDRRADVILPEAVEQADAREARSVATLGLAERALLAMARGEHALADAYLGQARAIADDERLLDCTSTAVLLAASARAAVRHGERDAARDDLARAHRLRPGLTLATPYFAVQARVELARAHLALGDGAGARTVTREAAEILRVRPRLGILGAQLADQQRQLQSISGTEAGWASTLTAAELRLLPLLTTHLSFKEIAERLSVSRNTIKTQAISTYRKLGASSRGEAIEHAAALGLIDPLSAPGRSDFIP